MRAGIYFVASDLIPPTRKDITPASFLLNLRSLDLGPLGIPDRARKLHCAVADVRPKRPRGDLVLKHFLELDVGAALHLRQAKVQVQAHGHRGREEDEADPAAQVRLVRVDQVRHQLQHGARDGRGAHDVDGVGLLPVRRGGGLTADGVGHRAEGCLILFRGCWMSASILSGVSVEMLQVQDSPGSPKQS